MPLRRYSTSLVLIFTGFFLIALLLIVGQVAAIVSVDRLARLGRESVYHSAETLQASQLLATDVTFLDRAARQFDITNDPALYDVYVERRSRLLQDAVRLQARPLSQTQRERLVRLLDEEAALSQVLSGKYAPARRPPIADHLAAIDGAARSILAESGDIVGTTATRIQEAAWRTQRQLIGHAIALIPAALLLAAVYGFLISRPIRQIKRAIAALGEGKMLESVRVTGPGDLVELGRQLDWLRLRLRGLEQHKVTILRNISHELKTPLAAVREGVELLNDEVPGTLNRRQAEITRILQSNSLRLQTLIEDLINFSIAQAEDPFLNDRPVQLHRLLERVVDDQQTLLAARRLEIRRDFVEATVVGEQDKLKSIFDNLLSNAIKYSPPGAHIDMHLRREAGQAIIDVRDQGPGIDPRERDKVFDAFYQGRAPAGDMKGSGLGLSIAHAYVRRHKGTIEVVDTEGGAHIRVALPLAGA